MQIKLKIVDFVSRIIFWDSK